MLRWSLSPILLFSVVACSDSSEDVAVTVTTVAVATTAMTSIPTSTLPPTTTPSNDVGLILAEFDSEVSLNDWYVQNDTVMGGVSSSELSWNDGDVVFSGNLSTDNNGGFTSMRGPVVTFIPASGLTAISVVAQGDGRTYLMQIRTDTDSYIQRFTPVETMSETLLALTDFTATDWRLSPIPDRPPLVSEAVRQVAVYLVDKQVGEFVLRLRSISMVAD